MKQKDIAIIIIVCFVSAVASLFISRAIFTAPKHRQQQVEVVEAISTEFNKPDAKYFNNESLNPTRLIKIGENPNPQPFFGPPQPQ